MSRSRRLAGIAFAIALGGVLSQAAPSFAQKEGVINLRSLVPGDAFIAVHVRMDKIRTSPWFALLPDEFRRGLDEGPIPLGKVSVREFIFVHQSPRTLGFGGGRDKP